MANALIVTRIKKRTGLLTAWLVVYHTLCSGARQSQEQLLCVAGGSCPSVQYECTAWGHLSSLNRCLCREEGGLCAQGDNIWTDYIILQTHECFKILLCQAGSRAEFASCVGIRFQVLPGDSVSFTICLALYSEEEDGHVITTLLTKALFFGMEKQLPNCLLCFHLRWAAISHVPSCIEVRGNKLLDPYGMLILCHM